MADEVLFAGGRLDSLTVISGAPTENGSPGSSYGEAAYVDAVVRCSGTTQEVVAAIFRDSSFSPADVVTGERLYLHWDTGSVGTPGTTIRTLLQLIDSSGFPWLAMRATGTSGRMGLYYNSGTGASPVWTLLGSDWAPAGGAKITYDIMLTLGSPHSVTLMQDNATVLVAAATFTQASLASLRQANFGTLVSNQQQSHSQILITRGIPTFGAKVKYSRATGAGSNSGWSGAATNVNEAVNSDATFDSTTSSGAKQTYAMGDVTVPSGFEIKSVFNFVRAKNDGTAPNNIKSVIRSGGTDYSSANLSGIGLTFASLGFRYDTDPATSAAWTQAGWNAAEAGYESAT